MIVKTETEFFDAGGDDRILCAMDSSDGCGIFFEKMNTRTR